MCTHAQNTISTADFNPLNTHLTPEIYNITKAEGN
jgi:hypothetical protein